MQARLSTGPSSRPSVPGSPGHRDSGNVSGGSSAVGEGALTWPLRWTAMSRCLSSSRLRGPIPADRVMRNPRRHLRQLRAYLDTAVEDMEAGPWEGIVGALL